MKVEGKMEFIRFADEMRFHNHYNEIHHFLKENGGKGLNENWHWARWEWLVGHPNLEEETMSFIGMWKENDEILAVATHDMRIGEAYIICKAGFNDILDEALQHVEESLSHNGLIKLIVNVNDNEMIKHLVKNDYLETDGVESILSLDCSNGAFEYKLPNGYKITSYDVERDDNKHSLVIFKGFEDEGEPQQYDDTNVKVHEPHFEPHLTVYVVSPEGEYVAHCGMWYSPETEEAYIEPVVTIPSHRKLGLGKAVVYECVNRCIALGANKALVISNQPFYFNIGFEQSSIYKYWEKMLFSH